MSPEAVPDQSREGTEAMAMRRQSIAFGLPQKTLVALGNDPTVVARAPANHQAKSRAFET
jgi:hypothetical protein